MYTSVALLMAIKDALVTVNNNLHSTCNGMLRAGADDIHLTGTPEAVIRASAQLKEELQKIGLKFNPNKCFFSTNNIPPSDELSEFTQVMQSNNYEKHVLKATFDTDGYGGITSGEGHIFGGLPVGSDAFMSIFAANKCRDMADRVYKAVARLSGQATPVLYTMLIFSLQKLGLYHFAAIPYHLVKPHIHYYTSALDFCLDTIRGRASGTTLTKIQSMRSHLPFKDGGIGLFDQDALHAGSHFSFMSKYIKYILDSASAPSNNRTAALNTDFAKCLGGTNYKNLETLIKHQDQDRNNGSLSFLITGILDAHRYLRTEFNCNVGTPNPPFIVDTDEEACAAPVKLRLILKSFHAARCRNESPSTSALSPAIL